MSSHFLPSETRPRALITGGNGFVGSHLAERLWLLGYEITLLLRSTSSRSNISGLIYREVIGDITDPSSLSPALENVDYVFHCAGLVKAASGKKFFEVNETGTENLLEAVAAQSSTLKRFVYISSQSAAGPCESHRLKSEDETPTPVSVYGRSKLAGERAVLRFSGSLPITIVRPSAVFGPRDTEVFTFFKTVKLGLLLKFGIRESFVSLVYINDLVSGIVQAATSPKGIGETFFINSADDFSQWEAQQLIAKTMKLEIRPLTIPVLLLKLAGSLSSGIRFDSTSVPMFSRDKANELSCRWWLSSSAKAREMLNYHPEYSVQRAFQETWNWYRDCRWL